MASNKSKYPLNLAHYDWVSVTTWRKDIHDMWVAILGQMMPASTVKPDRVMQYKGVRGEHAFIGQGLQTNALGDNRMHFMVVVSGYDADRMKELLHVDGTKLTRLDVCVTIDKPKGWDSDDVLFELRNGGYSISPLIGMVSISKAKGTTIGINKRGEWISTRWYEKSSHKMAKARIFDNLRYETEAGKKGCTVADDIDKLSTRMYRTLDGMPSLNATGEWVDAYYVAVEKTAMVLEEGGLGEYVKMVNDKGNTWEWYAGIVANSMIKYGKQSASNRRDLAELYSRILSEIDGGQS